MPGYTTPLTRAEAADFFAGVTAILASPNRARTFSTRMAVVEIYLPLTEGTVKATWREEDLARDVNPLLEYIQEFATSHYRDG